jgi:hypothetical protein
MKIRQNGIDTVETRARHDAYVVIGLQRSSGILCEGGIGLDYVN